MFGFLATEFFLKRVIGNVTKLERRGRGDRRGQHTGFREFYDTNPTRVAIAAGPSDNLRNHVDRQCVALLAHHLDGLMQEEFLQNVVDVTIRKRNIESHRCLVGVNMELRDLGAGILDVDFGNVLRLGLNVAEFLLELLSPVTQQDCHDHEHNRHDYEKDPTCLHIDLSGNCL